MLFAISVSILMLSTVYACPQGKVTCGGQIVVGSEASFGFNTMQFSRDAGPKGELQYKDHVTGMTVHAHKLEFLEVYGDAPGNKPSTLRGARFNGPCNVKNLLEHEDGDTYRFQLIVHDDGEPKTPDYFSINVWKGAEGDFVAGSPEWVYGADVYYASPSHALLHGNIQTHKAPK